MSLHLTRFSSQNFRNLEGAPFQLDSRFNLFYGENGQGKTNLLEAVYYLFTLRALRSVRPRELLAWGEQDATVYGEVCGRVDRDLSVTFSKRGRKIRLNGAPPLQIDDYFDDTYVVAFTPEEIQLIRGAPEARRRFLDRAIFNTDVSYLSDVRSFLKVLSHRNATLKKENLDESLLEVLNEQLLLHGTKIIHRRLLTLARIRDLMRPAFDRIFPEANLNIEVLYQSNLGSWKWSFLDRTENLEQTIQDRFIAQMKKVAQRERERRTSLVGPHLDDISFTLDGRRFKHAASQGQTRALVLALKIAEIADIEQRTGQHPLLLLDDVAGELDPRHSSFFFRFLEETRGQVLLSTTSLSYIQLPDLARYPCFRLSQGKVFVESFSEATARRQG